MFNSFPSEDTPRKSRISPALLFVAATLLASAANAQSPAPPSNVSIDRHAGKITVRWNASSTQGVSYHVTYKPDLNHDPRDNDEIGTDLGKNNVWQLGDIDAPCALASIERPFFTSPFMIRKHADTSRAALAFRWSRR